MYFSRYPTNSIDLPFQIPDHNISYSIIITIIKTCHTSYRPRGLLALPFLTVLPVMPGLDAMLAAPPALLVDSPRGFPLVVARLPAAPVMSLSELPYSRTMSPQPRDVFAMLLVISDV